MGPNSSGPERHGQRGTLRLSGLTARGYVARSHTCDPGERDCHRRSLQKFIRSGRVSHACEQALRPVAFRRPVIASPRERAGAASHARAYQT
jgi:hypothetical protein